MSEKSNVEKMDYAAFLADLERKRALLDNAIASLRAVVAAGESVAPAETVPGVLGLPSLPTHNAEIPDGAFFRKGIPEAAKLYLGHIRKKQTVREIADALKAGGIESRSRKFPSIVATVLGRVRKTSGDFIKFPDGTWGLAAWYPAGFRPVAGKKEAKRKKRKRMPRKGKKRVAGSYAKLSQTPTAPSPAKNGLQGRISSWMRANRGTEYSGKEVAAALNIPNVTTANLLLGKLAAKKEVEKTATGKYRATR